MTIESTIEDLFLWQLIYANQQSLPQPNKEFYILRVFE